MKTILISLITFMVGLLAGIVGHMTGIQPTKAVSEQSVVSKPVSTPAVEKLVAAPTATQRDPFVEWAAALHDGKLNDSRLRDDLLDRMTAADPARAWRLLMTSRIHVTQADIERIARNWQEKNPREAVTFGLTLTDPLQRPAFLRQVLAHWFMEQPTAFADWFSAQPNGPELLHHINWSNMVYHSRAATLEDLDSLMRVSPPYDSFPDLVGRQFHRIWKQPDQQQAATAWLRGLADVQVRDTTWKQLITEVSKTDPQAAAGMLLEIGDPKLRREASSTITAHLAQSDPQAALNYAATLPDEKARTTAWQSALSTWTVNNPQQALEFIRQNLQTLTPELLSPAAWRLAEKVPAETLAIATSFPASNERTGLINSLFSAWRAKQPLDAKRWLESTQAAILPAADLERLRAMGRDAAAYSGPVSSTAIVNGRRVSYSY